MNVVGCEKESPIGENSEIKYWAMTVARGVELGEIHCSNSPSGVM